MKANRTQTGKTPAQAMVEFALILPILLLLIYGIIEVGRVLFIYSSIVTSARTAARYGATTGLNDAGAALRYQDCAGMRAAARRSAFIDSLADADIVLQHDKGEGQSTATYCTPGNATDSTFIPSAGNTDRVRVTVSTQYSPIVPLVPLEPFTISSTAARTVLVSVPIQITAAPLPWNAPTNTTIPTPTLIPTATSTLEFTSTASATATITGTPTITETPTKTGSPTNTGTATNTGTPTYTPSPTATSFACTIKHSALKTSPTYSMTIFNDSVGATIHVLQIQITWNTQGNQTLLGAINLGGQSLWIGVESGSPSVLSSFTGDISILPGSSELMQLTFDKPYNTNGTEQIIVTFTEASCPLLDSSNASQLK